MNHCQSKSKSELQDNWYRKFFARCCVRHLSHAKAPSDIDCEQVNSKKFIFLRLKLYPYRLQSEWKCQNALLPVLELKFHIFTPKMNV